MLVVSRKKGQTLHVGDAVIVFEKIGENTIRVGIKAPKHVRILRGELVTDAKETESVEEAVKWM